MEVKSVILVVDDEPMNRRLLEAMLTPLGYAILTACDGQEALEKVSSTAVDLVLMDLTMPRMDGLAACRKIKENPSTRLLPVILVTGRDVAPGAWTEEGATDTLAKPFDRVVLIEKIQKILCRKK